MKKLFAKYALEIVVWCAILSIIVMLGMMTVNLYKSKAAYNVAVDEYLVEVEAYCQAVDKHRKLCKEIDVLAAERHRLVEKYCREEEE